MTRRELCTYGIAIGTVADQAVKDLATIRVTARYPLEDLQMATNGAETSKQQSLDAYEREIKKEEGGSSKNSVGDAIADLGRSKGKGKAPDGSGGEATKDTDTPVGTPTPTISSLPKLFIKAVFGDETHRCLCYIRSSRESQ